MSRVTHSYGEDDSVIHFAVGTSCLGPFLVAQTKNGIRAIFLGEDTDALLQQLRDNFPQKELIEAESQLGNIIARVAAFIEQPQREFSLPLDIQGTPFQQKVWAALCEIPLGTTISYSMLAKRMGRPTATRAIASACAANTLAIVIPCHRVVKQNGELSGYRWGTDRKRALLSIEHKAIKSTHNISINEWE